MQLHRKVCLNYYCLEALLPGFSVFDIDAELTVCHLNNDLLDGLVVFFRVEEMGSSKLLCDFQLMLVDIHTYYLFGARQIRSLYARQSDASEPARRISYASSFIHEALRKRKGCFTGLVSKGGSFCALSIHQLYAPTERCT